MKKIILCLVFLQMGCATGNLKVTSSPDQAEVFVVTKDQTKSLGKTPIDVRNSELSKGSYQIAVSKPGFQDEMVVVPESIVDTNNMVHVDLKKVQEQKDISSVELNTLTTNVANCILLIRQKNYDQAEQMLNALTTKYPNVSILYELLGNIYYLKKDLAKSEQSYSKAKELNPNNTQIDKMITKIKEIKFGSTGDSL